MRDILKNPKIRMLTDYANVVRNKIDDLNSKIWKNNQIDALVDQFPGKTQPFCYSKLWGPLDFTDAVDGVFQLPRQGNLVVGRQGAFHWIETNVAIYVQVRDTSTDSPDHADIFDKYVPTGGGAILMNTIGGVVSTNFRGVLAFEMILYDKLRGRAVHESKFAQELISSQNFSHRIMPKETRLEPNTELEPRLFVLEPILVSDRNLITFNFYVNIMFKGYISLEDERLHHMR